MKQFVGIALVAVLGSVPAKAATHSITAPSRAVAAFASDAKAVVNVRGVL